ncbi:PTPRQ [Mytilus edulis]|uniref:PTPRQ n=1 Tax=Mytilus edulis TaxID=6550 RepID=A0A8S3QAC5_MYTED|nr:PTPRQ [Mytilus edulis]
MGKLDIRTIYIIFASAFLVNPVLLQNSTTISTSQSSSQVPPSTTMAITTTILAPPITTPLATTAPMPTSLPTTTTQPTTTTTTATTTTAVPIEIGKNCSSSPGSCESNDLNSECKEEKCQCKDGFFELGVNCEPLTSLLPTSLSLTSTETTITVAWDRPTGLNSSEYQLEYKVSVKGDNFDQTNTTTEENITVSGLTAGQIYNVYVLTVFNDSIPSESVNKSIATIPSPPDCPSTNGYKAPNITITWNQIAGADEYSVQFESRTSFNVTHANASINFVDPGRNYIIKLITYAHNRTSKIGTCVIRTESEVPDPPKNVTIAGTLGKDNFNISITEPDELRGDIAGYRINIYGKNYMDEELFMLIKSDLILDTMDNVYQITGLQAEPGQVTSFNMSTERDSFTIEFQRPIEPNGDIIQYVIVVNGPQVCKEYRLENISFVVNQSCDGVPSKSQIQLNQKKMELSVTELSPFVEYRVNIWAYTKEGQGVIFPTTVMTAISAPYMPRNVIATAVTSTSVRVEWETPQNKTGPTNYTVTAFNEIDKRDVKSTSCNTHSKIKPFIIQISHCTIWEWFIIY